MPYLFCFFEKAAKFEIVVCCKLCVMSLILEVLGASIKEMWCIHRLVFPSALPRGETGVSIYVVILQLSLTLMEDNFL